MPARKSSFARLPEHCVAVQDETRLRLLQAAAEVFAEVGYHAATTREICRRGDVNLASIHYHFGDKAELYREVFRLPFMSECNTFAAVDVARTGLAGGLRAFYDWLFPRDAEGDPMRERFMRLHAREQADPSGVLGDAMLQAFRPNHEKLQALLCREFGVKKPDAEIDRLTFALSGMATVYFHNRIAVEHFAPRLIAPGKAGQAMAERLAGYALALVEAERERRAEAANKKDTKKRKQA